MVPKRGIRRLDPTHTKAQKVRETLARTVPEASGQVAPVDLVLSVAAPDKPHEVLPRHEVRVEGHALCRWLGGDGGVGLRVFVPETQMGVVGIHRPACIDRNPFAGKPAPPQFEVVEQLARLEDVVQRKAGIVAVGREHAPLNVLPALCRIPDAHGAKAPQR